MSTPNLSIQGENDPRLRQALYGALALAFVVYFPVLQKMYHLWLSDEDMSHGVFVPVVAGYAVWMSRGRLASLSMRFHPLGLVICALAAATRLLASLSGEVLLGRIALMLTILGILYLFYGLAGIRELKFPLFLLLFAIPIPRVIYTSLTLSLQMVASSLSEYGLDAIGYTVLREGNILHLPGQTLSVAEACSGIRSLYSISFLVVAYLYFHEDRGWPRWFVLAATVPVAIASNALRIVITGILGDYNPEYAEGLFHATAGWVLSFAGFAALVGLHVLVLRFQRARGHWNLAEAQ